MDSGDGGGLHEVDEGIGCEALRSRMRGAVEKKRNVLWSGWVWTAPA